MAPRNWVPPAEHGSSPLAVVAAVLLLITGVLLALLGAMLLLVGAAGPDLIAEFDPSLAGDAPAFASIMVALGLILLVAGILQIIASVGVFVHRTWARWLGVVLGSMGVILGLFLLLVTFVPPAGGTGDIVIGLVWLGAHGFVVAALAAAGPHFQPRYPGR